MVSVEPSKEPPIPTNSNRGNATTQVRQAGTFTQALRESLRWLSSHAGSESPLLNKNLKTISAVRVDPCDLPKGRLLLPSSVLAPSSKVASHSKVSTGGRGREEKKEKKKGKEKNVFPAATQASKATPREEEKGSQL